MSRFAARRRRGKMLDMKKALREIVLRMVEDILEEKFGRRDYIDDLCHVMDGALGEEYKLAYAVENGLATEQDVADWKKEVDDLLRTEFKRCAQAPENGFKRRRAFVAALSNSRGEAHKMLTLAKYQVAKKFDVRAKDLVDPSDDVTDEFFARLENEFDAALAELTTP